MEEFGTGLVNKKLYMMLGSHEHGATQLSETLNSRNIYLMFLYINMWSMCTSPAWCKSKCWFLLAIRTDYDMVHDYRGLSWMLFIPLFIQFGVYLSSSDTESQKILDSPGRVNAGPGTNLSTSNDAYRSCEQKYSSESFSIFVITPINAGLKK